MVTSLFAGLKISFKSADFGTLQEYWNYGILQYLKKMIFQVIDIGFSFFFYISDRYEIKLSIDIIFV